MKLNFLNFQRNGKSKKYDSYNYSECVKFKDEYLNEKNGRKKEYKKDNIIFGV